jgi:anaerobic magnesium-protoporphyrin IX monomethyl ester cyclase
MTRDVLFGQAYFLRFDPKMWEAQQPYAPLGALYAAASVRAHGYSVAFFDAMLAASETEWIDALERTRPRVAVIYEDSFNYLSKMCLLRMRQAALAMVAAAAARGVRVIVAGSDATDHPAPYLDQGALLVVTGEGEATVVEILDAIERASGRPLAAIDGICYREPSGEMVRTRKRDMLRDLDTLPLPAWDLVDVEQYRRAWLDRHGYFSMNIATTRGCPYRCNWCAKPIYGQRYVARAPARVVDEIVWLNETYRPDHLWVADDIFGLKPGWIEEFAALAVARHAVVPFKCLLRADGVTPKVARALRQAGCRTVWIGAESGSQRILDAMDKGTTVAEIETARALLGQQHIEVGFFLQFGYPGETLDDIQLTRQLVRRAQPDDIGISVSYPLPGTPFFERVKNELGTKQNWVDSDDLAMMYRGTYPPEFYRALHALVHAEFRGRRALRLLQRVARAPLAMGARDARQMASGALQAARWPVLRRRVHALAQR